MDNDISLAVKLQLNDLDIYDENIINKCLLTNNIDIYNMINDTFYMDLDEVKINYSEGTETHIQNVNYLYKTLTEDQYELINNNKQRELRTQYNEQRNIPNTINISSSQLELLSNLVSNFSNIFNQMGNNITVSTIFQVNIPSEMVQSSVPIVLTNDSIDKIIKMSYKEIKTLCPNLDIEENCVICCLKLTEDQDNTIYTKLPCDHVYHYDCIIPYLKNFNYICPICKEPCGEHIAKIE